MDQIFTHVADQIALSGPSGTLLTTAITSVIPSPRPALTRYLREQFEKQPLFTVTPTASDAHITAHPALCRRALGFSPIENPPLPQPAWALLEAIARAGPSGMLQSKMGPVIGMQASMVHHYIGLLSSRRLIGRRKTILHRPKNDATVAVVYTSVIVLARYAAQMLDPVSPGQAPDSTSDVRLQRVLNALRQPPHVRAERDLKIIAIPDSEKPPTMTRELFQRRRHRHYRSLRRKLLRLGVAITKRKCVTQSGRVLGAHPCLKLLESDTDFEAKDRRFSHPLLAGGVDRFVAEVDIVEQVYRLLVEAGPSGISVPEVQQYLDSKGVTSAPAKRIRSIITAISKMQPIVERQYFEGSAMYLRISLHTDNDASGKRRKIGMTALGERRQEIVMELLREQKVLILETLGREIARVEDGAILRVDPKVLRRLISDLVTQKRIKLITTARPTIKDTPRSQNLVLVALPDVDERGDVVKKIVTTVVNRSLYGPRDDARESDAKRARERKKKAVGKVRKRISFEEEDDEDESADNSTYEESESDEEPVVMYQANDSDNEESVDEEDSEEEHSGIMTRQRSARMADKIGSSRSEQEEESLKKGKKKVSLRRELQTEVKEKMSRKRKVSQKRDRRSTKRPRSERKAGELKDGKVETKKSEKAKPDGTPRADQECKQGEDAAILIKSQTRNLKGSRILRLRAVDYGCLKGKLARIRRFHKNLYEIMRARNGNDLDATPPVEHIAIEAARETPVLGRFSFLSMLKVMTVGEYAATVGIYMDHGDAIKKIEREKIVDVLDDMKDEITSNIASRQVQQFVQTMTKLELIQSDVDSQWLLTGAGIIRDFGRGLPSGVVPHAIAFSSFKAVEEYWLELEQFSRCKMSRKPISIDLRKEENVKKHVETHPVGDLYFPKRWEAGIQRLQKHEQLNYETILQRLSGVQIALEDKARLRTDNFIKGKLRRFDVEEIDKEMEKVLADMQKEGDKPQLLKKVIATEQLLLYSRFRTANPIPKWFLKDLEAVQKKDERPHDGNNEATTDNSCMLQLTRTPSSIKGQQVRAAMPSVFDANHRRYFKTRTKRKLTKESTREGWADVKRLIPLIKAIIRGRAIAYHRNDAEGLDWKVIPSLARFELQQSASGLKEAVERENLRRAIVSLCEITTVRAALDILSLKLVLKLHDLSTTAHVNENREPWSAVHASKTVVDLVNNWDSLDSVCSAIVAEFRDDVRHHTQVFINTDGSLVPDSIESRRNVLKKEFHMTGFLHGRPQSFAHTIEMMASRFRRVADIHLFREVRYAILLSQPYGEVTGDERELEDRGAIQFKGIEEVSGSQSGMENREKTAMCITDSPEPVGEEPQKFSRASDEERTPLSDIEKRSAIQAEQNETPDLMEETRMRGKISAIADPQAGSTMVQNIEGAQGTGDIQASAVHVDPFSTYKTDNAPYCPAELAELVVCAAVRQPPHAQWKAECLKLLSQFREEDLANARDRLILRGSISIHAEREKPYCCLQPCKYSQPTETMATLRGDKGDRDKWDEELREAGDGCLENRSLWRDVCSLECISSFATAYSTYSTFFDGPGMTIVPEFEEDDEATPAAHDDDEDEDEDEDEAEDDVVTRIKLYFQYKKEGDSRGSHDTRRSGRKEKKNHGESRKGAGKFKNISESITSMRQKVAHEIAESGCDGISLEMLLQRLNPHTEDEKLAISAALSGLLQDGGIRRFAVETDDEDWRMTTGVLYICTVHCPCKFITAWRTPNGEVDQQLVRWVRDEVFEHILGAPGLKCADVIHSVCARHTSLPRRAVADILFSLEGDILTSTIAIWQDGWQIVRASPAFVDEIAIVTFGKRCIQSYSGNAAKLFRIDNSQSKRLSQLL